MPPKKKKKPKKSVQRTVAESKDAPKRLRGEAITGETMKLHPKIQKAKKKARKTQTKSWATELALSKSKVGRKLHGAEKAFRDHLDSPERTRLQEAEPGPKTDRDAAKFDRTSDRLQRKRDKAVPPYEKAWDSTDIDELDSKFRKEWGTYRGAQKEAKKLVKGREKTSPSATVGKAGKEMETRRRKKKKD